jgi:glycosyltransferase involved in cell wall biosynthesis
VKLLVISNLYPPDVIGGYELGCQQVVDALRARAHEVKVLTSTPRSPVPGAPHVSRSLKLVDLFTPYIYEQSLPVMWGVWKAESAQFNAQNVYALLRTLEEFQPDVVYVWLTVGLGGLGLLACLKHLAVPWVWHLMDDVPVSLCKSVTGVVPELAKEVSRQLDGTFLVCSQRVIDEVEAAGIALGGKVEIIPNWVRGRRPPERTAYYRGGHLRIMYAGQIGEHKGVDLLIHAAAMLQGRGYADFSFDLYGKATKPHFHIMVQQLDVAGHVRFQGERTQAELGALYDEHDVFAFPTWSREPFAFAPLEAAARGCLPLISSVCGNSEWFVDGTHCLKIERTSEALAATLAAIMEGQIDLEPIARRSCNAVWRHFHLDAQIPRIEQALAQASLQSRAGAGSPDEFYRMAVLAEKLSHVIIQDRYRDQARRPA